jgi:hypothetical protein
VARSKYQTQFWCVKWLGINPVINSVFIITTAGVACPTGKITGCACRGNHQQPPDHQENMSAVQNIKPGFGTLNDRVLTR